MLGRTIRSGKPARLQDVYRFEHEYFGQVAKGCYQNVIIIPTFARARSINFCNQTNVSYPVDCTYAAAVRHVVHHRAPNLGIRLSKHT